MHKTLLVITSLTLLSACGPAAYVTKTIAVTGAPGLNGSNGSSCSVQTVSNGSLITCSDGTASLVTNGINGLNGSNGTNGADGHDGADAPVSAYQIVEIIDPCGDQPGFDEVLLRLQNGKVIAHYASGAQQFLTVLQPGSYVTTDGQNCFFNFNSNGTISY